MVLSKITNIISKIGLFPIILVVTVLSVIFSSYFIADLIEPLFTTQNQIELTNIIISGVLSIALVLAYIYSTIYQRRLTNIQETQTDILEDQAMIASSQENIQEQLKQAELKPKIGLDEFHARGIGGVILRLSNVGRGLATNLQMEVIPVTSHPQVSVEKDAHVLVQHTADKSDWVSGRSDNLGAGETHAEFRGSVNMYSPIRGREIYFSEVTQFMYSNGKRNFRFKIVIKGKDITGDGFEEEVLDYIIPIKKSTSLEEGSKYGMRYEVYRNNKKQLERGQNKMEGQTGQHP